MSRMGHEIRGTWLASVRRAWVGRETVRPMFDDCQQWHNLTGVPVAVGGRRRGHRHERTRRGHRYPSPRRPGLPAGARGGDRRRLPHRGRQPHLPGGLRRRRRGGGASLLRGLHRYAAPCDQAGETCPIAQCQESGQPSRVLHVHFTARGPEHEEVTTHPIPEASGGGFLEVIRPAEIASAGPAKLGLVGHSPAFSRMLDLATRVAAHRHPVLLLGESGKGKEGLAQAIHEMSSARAVASCPSTAAGSRSRSSRASCWLREGRLHRREPAQDRPGGDL